MKISVNYRIINIDNNSTAACEIHINGQLAAILSRDEEFALHPAKDFTDRSVSPEQLQGAVEGAMEKLMSFETDNQSNSQ